MAPKRREDDGSSSDELIGRKWKKQKTAAARTIAVQSQSVEVAGSSSRNAVAGPSKAVRFDSMQGLPDAINIEKFAEARAFEISAMSEAMTNAHSNTTKRAWQQLPRHLRRRAASHNVLRVPKRLREKARAEMDPMRHKASRRAASKHGKLETAKRTEELLKRQRDKIWLETHLWHAKRMHMDDMWDYRLAITPTEKSFRTSHRASVHGSILHDASYFGFIELKGPEDVLRAALTSCCDCQGPSPGAQRFLTGSRICETHLYKHGAYPYDLIAPITVMWHPTWGAQPATPPARDEANTSETPASEEGKRKRKPKGKGKQREEVANPPAPSTPRTVWIRVHPAVFDDVYHEVRTATSFALEAAKRASPNQEIADVEIANLREHVNVFEIMGPKSSQIIKGALKLSQEGLNEEKRQFWNCLEHLQTSGSLPRGMIIGLTVEDPRLSFPPKNQKVRYESGPSATSPAIFPSAALATSSIWDESIREKLCKPKFKKSDIDQRRSEFLVPGPKLQPTPEDDVIPILLIQRSVEGPASTVKVPFQQHGTESPSLHGWTLIIPSGWAMPFFSSLTYTGTRVGGQRERQTQAYEGGCAYFPRDYPLTAAYDEYADDRAEEERTKWERKPPAKRVNYEKLGTRSPWKPDWGVVLGLESSPEEDDLVPTQREEPPATAGGTKTDRDIRPWLLRGTDAPSLVDKLMSTMLNPGAGLLDYMNQVRMKKGLSQLNGGFKADELWKGALVLVRVLMCGRGNPEDLATVYRVDDAEARKWMEAERLRKQGAALLLQEGDDETELSKLVPSQDDIIGYVTTGHYSLSRGEGHAVGAIPVSQLFELKQQAERLRAGDSLLVKIRDRGDNVCRAARLEVIG
ncbi:POP1-domain-containing protein [Laetiporus sulphureus 93-53]|uniref:POP1-domain-containing protein n=1 Tax=Laetiporus sulphureus 93-53 TaxID=1314785 RepID=A0A165HLJ5_9APHY|nr:POP1-domain-containing protein [Laetiporus sulphureus 93-53]KZT11889.1 POP1-domain-containing protein [Laetiporus sulphureus 93-53]